MNNVKVHRSFWLITIFFMIWNILGCINFFVQMNPEMVSLYRETEQAIIQGRPLWATAGFALGVFGGETGCLLLVLKKPAAFYLFIASLIGVITAIIHSLMIDIAFSTVEIMGTILMPVLVAVFLVWYARYALDKGWLKTTENLI